MGNTMEKGNSRGMVGISLLPRYILVKKSSKQLGKEKQEKEKPRKQKHGKENRRGQMWGKKEGKDQGLEYFSARSWR